ncbi:hypothetical protein [Desulfosporosinus sp. BICA1-9]|uniref:hypothetical protein n=1 Tax=Desulfosporosinus sp. BICA1-9 TaxID=1531958 RepID=UPI00054C21A4|nr:hypothetical protein [Desulfosporosinus sp. BICA1-9]KJS47081.1 MAG: hypothetical protein VR66_21655 [Peptococcaceae bacterium BRH_c23]KJS90437.1 MAG: hypothetical protein JL57_02015 [Desulfosporosinus sp. BICA1-9]HBW38619.1 hypothetical protein [Desulfosporosinus sp.]
MSDNISMNSETTTMEISRLIIERYLERKLKETEIVHHLNEVNDDDRTANLAVFIDVAHHAKFHKAKRKSQYIPEVGRTRKAIEAKILEKYGIVFYGPLYNSDREKMLKQMAERTKRELGLLR